MLPHDHHVRNFLLFLFSSNSFIVVRTAQIWWKKTDSTDSSDEGHNQIDLYKDKQTVTPASEETGQHNSHLTKPDLDLSWWFPTSSRPTRVCLQPPLPVHLATATGCSHARHLPQEVACSHPRCSGAKLNLFTGNCLICADNAGLGVVTLTQC